MNISLPLAAIASTLMLGLTASSALAQKDNPECEPNPVFSRFNGEVMTSCERARFKELELWVRESPKGGTKPMSVEGEYWYYFNEIQQDAKGLYPGKLEVRRNFENAVKAAKGTVLNAESGSVTFRIQKGNDVFWGVAGCGRGGDECEAISQKIVRVAGMEQSVVVTADQIAKSMGAEGKVVFYGIYFDNDKATLKPESAPTLVEMAKWLKSNAAAKVFIVGHTDMQGTLERNQKLARERAASVVAALTKDYGIKADRLTADGVGPLAPVASNSDEAGRAKNRRVEMVLR